MDGLGTNKGRHSTATAVPRHMPQLDGLRALAVLGVLVHHYINLEQVTWRWVRLPWGHLGVRLFFVLSGFLITGILLGYRTEADSGSTQKNECLWRFYYRRFLRIFPLYYMVLTIALLAQIPPTAQFVGWLATYTLNFKVAVDGVWPPQVGHFWTLAVEEQFYLLWPWLVLFMPRRWLKWLVLGAISAGPLYRWIAVANDFNAIATYSIPFASMDSLAMGAGIALMAADARRDWVNHVMNFIILPVAAVGTVVMHVWCLYDPKPNTVLFDLFVSMLFGWMIFRASCGFKGVAGSFLQAGPMTYLGRISYGIYIFHFFLPYFVWPWLNRHGFGGLKWQVLSFVLCSSGAIIIAAISWHLFERPILRFKDAPLRWRAGLIRLDGAIGER